jgi:hypothetical protein
MRSQAVAGSVPAPPWQLWVSISGVTTDRV